jgi:hypothetical protein
MRQTVFDLVPADESSELDLSQWDAILSHLSEFQPATRVEPQEDPPRAIRVWSEGEPEVAPALRARIEALVGTALRVKPLQAPTAAQRHER